MSKEVGIKKKAKSDGAAAPSTLVAKLKIIDPVAANRVQITNQKIARIVNEAIGDRDLVEEAERASYEGYIETIGNFMEWVHDHLLDKEIMPRIVREVGEDALIDRLEQLARVSGESIEPSVLEMAVRDIKNHIGTVILDATTSGVNCDPSLVRRFFPRALDNRSSGAPWYIIP